MEAFLVLGGMLQSPDLIAESLVFVLDPNRLLLDIDQLPLKVCNFSTDTHRKLGILCILQKAKNRIEASYSSVEIDHGDCNPPLLKSA